MDQAILDRRWLFALATAAGVTAAAGARSQPSPGRSPFDLTGVWTNGSYTLLERPKEFTATVISPAEAEAYEAPRRGLSGQLPSKPGDLGQAESEFNDQGAGLARIRGEIRTAWINDPVDGKIPYTEEARARLGLDKHDPPGLDNPEDRDTGERCLTAVGASAPILNSHDTNFIQIVQTPGDVVILSEKNHDVRVVRLDGAPWRPGDPRGWSGQSVGRWEGATLVVETAGFRAGVTMNRPMFLSGQGRVVERFTRTGGNELICAFRIADPSLFTQAWSGEILFRRSDKQLYEFACHEGNYALPAILAAARRAEGTPPAERAPVGAPKR